MFKFETRGVLAILSSMGVGLFVWYRVLTPESRVKIQQSTSAWVCETWLVLLKMIGFVALDILEGESVVPPADAGRRGFGYLCVRG